MKRKAILKESDIRLYIENLIDSCRKHPEIPIQDMLAVRDQAIRELGMGFKKEIPKAKEVKTEAIKQASSKPTNKKAQTVQPQTKKPEKPELLKTDTENKDDQKKKLSDYEILKSLSDPWN